MIDTNTWGEHRSVNHFWWTFLAAREWRVERKSRREEQEETPCPGSSISAPAHRGVVRDPAMSPLAGPKALRRDPLTHLSLDEEEVDDRFDALLQLAPGITVSGELPEQGLLE